MAAALCAAGARVKALELVSMAPFEGPEFDEGLGLSPAKMVLFRQAFAHLQALHVCFPSSRELGFSETFKALSDYLHSLPALAELVLTRADSKSARDLVYLPVDFLCRLHSSQLRSIQMHSVEVHSIGFLKKLLCRHADTLRQVELHASVQHHTYHGGDAWKNPFSQIGLSVIESRERICIYTNANSKYEVKKSRGGSSPGYCQFCFERRHGCGNDAS